MKGYEIANALRREADDVAREDRADLMRAASLEINDLIQQNRDLIQVCEDALTDFQSGKARIETYDKLYRMLPWRRKEIE